MHVETEEELKTALLTYQASDIRYRGFRFEFDNEIDGVEYFALRNHGLFLGYFSIPEICTEIFG